MLNKYLKSFNEYGFVKISFQKSMIPLLNSLKKKIKKKYHKTFKTKSFENFHEVVSKDEINLLRLDIINFLQNQNLLVFNIFEKLCPFMEKIIGEDVVAQRFINLGLQMPGDENKPEFHKDTPQSSIYEVVVWVPLVNCYKTMCMTLIPKKYQNLAEQLCQQNDETKINRFVKDHGKLIDVPFGDVVVFNANIFHYPHTNKTKNTRWSLNIRYKNLFTPFGQRNLLDYYKIIKSSNLTKMNFIQ